MVAQSRRQFIQDELSQTGKVVVSDLSERLGVTEETIRRIWSASKRMAYSNGHTVEPFRIRSAAW